MADLSAAPVVYEIPGMQAVPTRKDLVYKTAGERSLQLDLYYPPDHNGAPRPAVIFIHGEASPQMLEHAKDWGQYRSWGQLAAASGLIGVTFTHRSVEGLTCLTDVAGDIDDLVGYIRRNAASLGIDTGRLCIWTCSAGGPVGLTAALSGALGAVSCIVSYYGYMDLQHLDGWLGEPISALVTAELRQAFSPVHHLRSERAVPPMLVVRAGRDKAPQLNESVDRFVAEALALNLPLTLVNLPEAPHAFDIREDANWSRAAICDTLAFMRRHLSAGE